MDTNTTLHPLALTRGRADALVVSIPAAKAKDDPTFTRSRAYDELARLFGQTDWNSLSAALKAAGLTRDRPKDRKKAAKRAAKGKAAQSPATPGRSHQPGAGPHACTLSPEAAAALEHRIQTAVANRYVRVRVADDARVLPDGVARRIGFMTRAAFGALKRPTDSAGVTFVDGDGQTVTGFVTAQDLTKLPASITGTFIQMLSDEPGRACDRIREGWRKDFDGTDVVLALVVEDLHDLEDRRDSTDHIGTQFHTPLEGDEAGGHDTEIVDEILTYFGFEDTWGDPEGKLAAITADDLAHERALRGVMKGNVARMLTAEAERATALRDAASVGPVIVETTRDDDITYLTNDCCEHAHGHADELDALGLGYSDLDGDFYPLTAEEARFIGEDIVDTPFAGAMTGYATLWRSRKWLTPCLEFHYQDGGPDDGGDDDLPSRDEALSAMKTAAAALAPILAEVGGHMRLDADSTDDRHTLEVLLPFDLARAAALDFTEWRTFLDRDLFRRALTTEERINANMAGLADTLCGLATRR